MALGHVMIGKSKRFCKLPSLIRPPLFSTAENTSDKPAKCFTHRKHISTILLAKDIISLVVSLLHNHPYIANQRTTGVACFFSRWCITNYHLSTALMAPAGTIYGTNRANEIKTKSMGHCLKNYWLYIVHIMEMLFTKVCKMEHEL